MRMVRAVKLSLYHVFNKQFPITLADFHTAALVMVEGMYKARLLIYKRSDTDALSSLTPAHSLGCPPYRSVAPPPAGGWNLQKAWHLLQSRVDHVWARFLCEMQPELQKRQKWHKNTPDLKPGAAVVVYLDDKAGGRWGPLARVVRLERSRDGQQRRVVIRTEEATYSRACNKIMPLFPPPEPPVSLPAPEPPVSLPPPEVLLSLPLPEPPVLSPPPEPPGTSPILSKNPAGSSSSEAPLGDLVDAVGKSVRTRAS